MSLIGWTFSGLFAESDRVISSQERYNLATFMVLFFLITIEVVLVKVATYEYEISSDVDDDDDDNDESSSYSRHHHHLLNPAAIFFDPDD